MKKRIPVLILVFAMLLSTVAIAAVNSNQCFPSLTFSGTTAKCFVDCTASNSDDEIAVTMTLYENGAIVAGWNGWGDGYVTLDKTFAATSKASYQLKVSYSVNNVAQPSVSVYGTCP